MLRPILLHGCVLSLRAGSKRLDTTTARANRSHGHSAQLASATAPDPDRAIAPTLSTQVCRSCSLYIYALALGAISALCETASGPKRPGTGKKTVLRLAQYCDRLRCLAAFVG
jgi:hypothetical protein